MGEKLINFLKVILLYKVHGGCFECSTSKIVKCCSFREERNACVQEISPVQSNGKVCTEAYLGDIKNVMGILSYGLVKYILK